MAEPTTEASRETAPPRRSSRISARQAAAKQVSPQRRRSDTGTKRGAAELDQYAADKIENGAAGESKKAKLPPLDADAAVTMEGRTSSSPAIGSADASDQMMGVNAGSDPQVETSAPPPHKAIEVGDVLPSLTLKNEKGEDVETSTLVAENGVVLFVVPKADTPGCTQQACGFRDIWEQFTTLNFDVYCLSADSPTAQCKWQTKKQLPYQLLSDPKRILIGKLGAADGNRTKRSHFVFGQGGKLVDKKIPVKPADSPRLALEAIQGMKQ